MAWGKPTTAASVSNTSGGATQPPDEAWVFAQTLLGRPIPSPSAARAEARAQREQLAWLASISTRHEQQLRAELSRRSAAIEGRERLEWLATFSPRHEGELRASRAAEAEVRTVRARYEQLFEDLRVQEADWDPSKHPRLGGPPNAGWFATTGGAASRDSLSTSQQVNLATPALPLQTVSYKRPSRATSAKQQAGVQKQGTKATGAEGHPTSGPTRSGPTARQSDPNHWYLPADDKGTWAGERGKSSFRLKVPVKVDGKVIREIQYIEGIPVLDKYALPGKTATIVLTGDHDVDLANAEKEWRRLNPGKRLPRNSTFHHDLLHVVEETVTINGKKTKVLVGKMQLIPAGINRIVSHQGSASVARRFYRGLNIDEAAVKALARDKANGGKVVARAVKRIIPGRIVKGVLPFVGRNVVRAIPIVGTGLAIIEFSDNVEAHGIGGAVARAVPVLGDLISAHDLGSDLAKQIRDDATAELDDHARATNEPVDEAWNKATEQTVEAFNDLAPQIQVTKKYGGNGLVDPTEVSDALKIYRGRMQQANLLRAHNAKDFDFNDAAAQAKQELKERLIKACQKDAPPQTGPLL